MDVREQQMNKALMKEIKQKRGQIREMEQMQHKPKSDVDSINDRAESNRM